MPLVAPSSSGALGRRGVPGSHVVSVVTRSTGTLTLLWSAATTATAFRELFVLRHAGDRWQISHCIFNATPAAE